MNSEQEMDDHLAISDSKTASDVSPEASSQNDSSKGIMCSMLDCCQKCVKEIMCKFLSNCGLSTIEDLKKNIPSKVEGMEFNVECYPEVFSYMEKLSSSDSKEKTFMKFWCLWPVLVIIDGYCSQFSQHAKFVDEIKELFTDATLLITACSKDVDNLGKKFISVSSKSKKKIIIDYMTHEQALDFAEKHFAATSIAESCDEKITILQSQDKICSPRSLYLRLELLLLPLISCFLKTQKSSTLELVKVLENIVKYIDCNLLFWGSVVHEAGPQMPTKLRSFIDENLCDLDRRWVMTERNYEVCFGCLSCISTPPDLTIDLRKCNQVNVVESMGLLFEKLPHDLFNLSSVDATLLYHSKAAPLRLNFPSWVKVKKVKGSISKDDISVVLQYPHLTSVYIKISQIHILTAFIDSINNSFEELQDVTLKLDASIAESHQEVNALREIEELAVKVVGVSKENFNNVVDILLKLLPKTNNGTTIELSSSNLGAPHCKKIIDVFSHFTGGLITVSSEVDLTSEEKESIKLLLSRDLDASQHAEHVSHPSMISFKQTKTATGIEPGSSRIGSGNALQSTTQAEPQK
ncbi:hypothetical protein FHG87_004239 [Trinorchestia longiramus]|nr:hypothetical protein FHG87_004239 [Trinorchestia longiramus]